MFLREWSNAPYNVTVILFKIAIKLQVNKNKTISIRNMYVCFNSSLIGLQLNVCDYKFSFHLIKWITLVFANEMPDIKDKNDRDVSNSLYYNMSSSHRHNWLI